MKNERIVAKINDLHDGEMKEISVGEKSVLLVRVNGEFHAIASNCSLWRAVSRRGIT